MLTENEKKIVDILKTVIDPETDLNVVDSGYIYGMTVTEHKTEIWVDFNQRVPECAFCKVVAWKVVETLSSRIAEALSTAGYRNIKVVEAANPSIVYKEIP